MATFEQAEALIDNGDYSQALAILQELADNGDANAMLEIGLLYDRGQGVPESMEQAADWYRKAAEKGNPIAQCNLGAAYDYGYGVEKNPYEAIRWYEMASDQGDQHAYLNLISLLSGNDDLAPDINKAIYHICRKAKGLQTPLSRMQLNDLAVIARREVTLIERIEGNIIYLYESEAQEAARKCMQGKPDYTSSLIYLIDIIYLPETDERVLKENQTLWDQCKQRRVSTREDTRKIPCIEVRYGSRVYGRFGFLIEDYHETAKPEKPHRDNPLINEDIPVINKLRLIKVQLENLRKKYNDVFSNVSSFNRNLPVKHVLTI